MKTRHPIGAAFRFLLFVILLAGAGWTYYIHSSLTPPQLPFQFTIKAGSNLRQIAQELDWVGALKEPYTFMLVVKVLGKEKSLKAGHYQLDRAVSIRQLADMISEGDVVLKSVTVIEGWTFKQMRTALNQHPDVQHDTTPLSDTQILARLEVNHSSAEGLFFPDTYHFSSGMSDLAIFRQAHQLMKDQLERAWEQRVQDLPLKNPYQALILASIVEKETGLAAERPLIAAVFINRLKRGMMLQTDPTVIYGLGVAFDGNLRRKDLVMDGPYNTYTRAGLPPTPICLPGGESLYAALHPAPSQALYFVSKGDGSHYFSETLSEHGQAVNRYQLN